MPLEAILSKSGESWVVGGVASNFFRDLDGDAIAPDAIQRAIPGFMANRGPDGLKGGPLRLHHGFWERFLKQAINSLNIPYEEQMGLLAAIALPLGRVTEMTVGPDGTTRWRGVLSQANPIARVIWPMLKEGMVHLGVSVGGKINATRPGRDALGRPCTLITDVRLDELSITDNPANRLLDSESPDNGAYIAALAKSLEKAIAPVQMSLFNEQQHPRAQGGKFKIKGAPKLHEQNVNHSGDPEDPAPAKSEHLYKVPFIAKHHVAGDSEDHAYRHLQQHYGGRATRGMNGPVTDIDNHDFHLKRSTLQKGLTTVSTMTVERFLEKALGGNPGAQIGSGSWRDTSIPEMGRGLQAKPTSRPMGTTTVQLDRSDSDTAGRGLGGNQPKAHRPTSSGGMPPTDVWGMTLDQLTRDLAKCCGMNKEAWGSPETVGLLTDSAHAIAGVTDSPHPELINFVRFLQHLGQFAQAMPHMDDYQAAGTVQAMNADLTKALGEFVESLPSDLKGKPLRPSGSPGVVGPDIQFPQQYVVYS